jgi:hypothetical protein
VSAVQVEPLLAEVTRWPFVYGLLLGEVQLQTYAYVPAEGFDIARNIAAYFVPAVNVEGLLKFAV